MNNEKEKELEKRRAISKAGFFVALACCFVALCIGTVSTVNNLSSEKAKVKNAEDVGYNVTDVPATQARERYISTESTTQEALTSAVNNTTEATTQENKGGEYVYPVKNTVINSFSNGELVYSETMHDYRVHNGIDISAEEREEVKAFADGKISKIYKDDLYGDAIIIEHKNGLLSYCFGVAPIDTLSEGLTVSAGDIIGRVTTVLCESADEGHIHFAVQRQEDFINPLTLLG